MGRKEALQSLGSGSFGTQGDMLDWSYYDEAVIAVATLTHRLFTNPLGAGGKTLDQTNLTAAGQIPQGQKLITHAIKIMYTSAAAKTTAAVQEFYTLLTRTTVAIKLQNKETMGLWTLQELLGSATLIAMTPTAAGDNIPLIQPKFHGVFPLNKKLVLAALTPFEVTITHHAAPGATTANDRLKIALSGILSRIS